MAKFEPNINNKYKEKINKIYLVFLFFFNFLGSNSVNYKSKKEAIWNVLTNKFHSNAIRNSVIVVI